MKRITHLKKQIDKKVALPLMATMLFLATSVGCFADDPTPAQTVINGFGTLKTDILIILAGIGALAISVYGVMAGWKFGKKIFNTVAK